MDIDPLAQYRRQQKPIPTQARMTDDQRPRNTSGTSHAPEAQNDELEPSRRFDGSGREIYEAFRVSARRCEHLEIRCAVDSWSFPHYMGLSDMCKSPNLVR
jgi:hypothetical protein